MQINILFDESDRGSNLFDTICRCAAVVRSLLQLKNAPQPLSICFAGLSFTYEASSQDHVKACWLLTATLLSSAAPPPGSRRAHLPFPQALRGIRRPGASALPSGLIRSSCHLVFRLELLGGLPFQSCERNSGPNFRHAPCGSIATTSRPRAAAPFVSPATSALPD